MQEVPVNVFWDIENCAVPNNMKGVQVVKAIRSFAMQAGILKNISAFANLKLIKEDLRADMQESGVLLHDVTRKANSSDLAILVEILKLVIDNKPPHCIVLISGDRDFANVLSTLTFRKYQVFLVHSPQASEVLKGAATMAFEWTQLLKRGGDVWNTPNQMPMNSNSTPYIGHYEKFQPLLDFLVAKGKPQVEFSELGNLIPFNKYGYPKLKDYIFDAQGHGLVKCGANKNIHWVALVDPRPGATPAQPPPLIIPPIANTPSMGNGIPLTPGLPPLAYRTPPTDKTTIARHLVTALESLKMDYFKPTESTLQKRIKQLNLPLQKIDWEEIVSVAQQKSFCIMGEKPNRTIFPPAGPFQGVDPSHPNTDNFPPRLWKSLQQFFIEVHPVVRVGRYGFAVFLKEQGPPEVREMPLGSITELVQLALHKQLLRYHKTQVSTILPDPDNPSAFIPENSPDLRPESYHNHNNFNHNHMRTSGSSDEVESLQLSPPGTPDDTSDSEEFVEDERARLVGVTFAWPYPGNSVLVTGSFFNWRNTIALHRRERDTSSTPPSSTPSTPTSSSSTATIPNNHQNPSITSPLLLPTSSPGPAGSPLLSPQQQQQSPFPSPSYPSSPSNFRDFNNKDHFGEIGAMCEPEDVFSTVLYLPPGKYEYKFIVDGAWHYDPHQLVVTDEVGNLNNIVEIKPLSNAQLTEPLLDHEFV